MAERLEGSAVACQRMQVILATIAGTLRVQEACAELGICEQRFEMIRATAIQAGIAALEARPIGRPPKVLTQAQVEIARLQERVDELEAQLQTALMRAELASTLPQLSAGSGKALPRSGRAKESNRSRPRPGKTPKR